jgi:hypothetical protein
MTIRIWRAGWRYPNKHVGTYLYSSEDINENVKFFQGQRIELNHEVRFAFEDSHLTQLDKLGCLWTNSNVPLVNGAIGEVILQHAEKDMQLFRAHAIARDGESWDYYLVNITCLVHCLDYERSIIDRFWENGEPRGISKLRFKSDACMNGHALARLKEEITTKLVSEELYQALSKLKYKGLHFELDSDGDGYRF